MTSNKRVKIYLKRNQTVLNFMWADISSDGSVMMGLSGASSYLSSIDTIYDTKGELKNGVHFKDLDREKQFTISKISFHASGKNKLLNKIKKTFTDRVTTSSIPFNLEKNCK